MRRMQQRFPGESNKFNRQQVSVRVEQVVLCTTASVVPLLTYSHNLRFTLSVKQFFSATLLYHLLCGQSLPRATSVGTDSSGCVYVVLYYLLGT